MTYALLLSALSLSAIAAYFSIIGLSNIFPGSIYSIITMAVALEVAKIIVAVWAHRNWKSISILTKFYLCFSVVTLMGITSTGIFGFLSKSHVEHGASSKFIKQEISEIERKTALEEEKITRERESIIKKNSSKEEDSETRLEIKKTLTSDISLIYSRLDLEINNNALELEKLRERLKGLDGSMDDLRNQKQGFFSSSSKKIQALELSQKEERDFISSEIKKISERNSKSKESANAKVDSLRLKISEAQNSRPETSTSDLNLIAIHEKNIKDALSAIESLSVLKFDLESKNMAIENELGPIKYIAELIVEFGGPEVGTDRSIRIVILLIVLVFDPLAIVMIICASSGFITKTPNPKPKPEPKPEPKPKPKPKPEPKPKPKPRPEPKPEPKPKPKPEPDLVWISNRDLIIKAIKDNSYSNEQLQWFYRWVYSGKPDTHKNMISVKKFNSFTEEEKRKIILECKAAILKNVYRHKDGYQYLEKIIVPNIDFDK